MKSGFGFWYPEAFCLILMQIMGRINAQIKQTFRQIMRIICWGMICFVKCERIKQQLDVTRHKRPYWDIALLESLGVSDFRISLDTGAKIYIKEDEFYNPAMVFTLCCNKNNILC